MAAQNTANLTFNINGIISNIKQLEKQVAGLSNVPINIGDSLKREIVGAKAEINKLLKSQQKGSATKVEMKADDAAFSRLIKHYERINTLQKTLATNHMGSFFDPKQIAELESLRKQAELTKQEIDKIAQQKVDLLVGQEPELQKMLAASGKQITDAQEVLVYLRQQTKELESQATIQQKVSDLQANKVNAAAVLARANITTRTSRAGVISDVFKSGGKGAFLQDLKDNVPDVYALMIEKIGASGSFAQFKNFLETGIDGAINEIKQSIPTFDAALAKNFQDAMQRVEAGLRNPDVNADRLEQEFKEASDAALLLAKNAEAAAKANAEALASQAGGGRGQAQQEQGKLGSDMLELDARSAAEQTATNLQTKVKQLLGFGAVLTQVSRMTRQAINQIKELDAAMTQIAVVTDFTTVELWGQIDAYMALAKQYGVTTKGVYEVSQLYYQQGLNTNQVMAMTTETLKMAKIAGLDYAKATDYMTVAIRGFKLDVEDAGRVVDVYSKLAAIAATDTRELAVAMSKTASIAESAGMSIESASSFLTLMIETTREAPENLGTAMKTIIARFQEMKKSPLELVEVEGEEASLNKVDKALQTVGISLTNASGQFRDLDDVIFDLSGKWDSLDRNTQRYIATTVAGSRQQSRFLALMSDNTRLTELYAESLDSEDAALLQYAKTLDSVESKINQVSTSFQQFYMSVLNGPVIGGVIDLFKTLIEVLNQIPKAIGIIGLTGIIKGVKAGLMGLINAYKNGMRGATASTLGFKQALTLTFKTGAAGATTLGAKLAVALNWIWLIGAALTVVVALFNQLHTTAEEAGEIAERDRIAAAQAKKDYKDLIGYEEALKKASTEKNDSLEAKQRWLDLNREIAESYPQLIETYDKEGNAIVALGDKYKDLTQTQLEAAQAAQETALASTVTEQVKIINETSKGQFQYDKDDIASFKRNVDFYREQAEEATKAQQEKRDIDDFEVGRLRRKYNLSTDIHGQLRDPTGKPLNTRLSKEVVERAREAIIEYNNVIGALETMRTGFLEFTTGLINLELFKIDAPEALKKNDNLAKNLYDINIAKMEESFRIDKRQGADDEIDAKEFYQYLSDNSLTFKQNILNDYEDFIDVLGSSEEIQNIFAKSTGELNVAEVKKALETTKDETTKALLENILTGLELNIENLMSQLTNVGYGSSTPGWETREGITIIPGLKTKLESLPEDLANGLVAQAVALADAQGAQSTVGRAFLGAITNISNQDVLRSLEGAEDATSWYGQQSTINAVNLIADIEQVDKAELQKLEDSISTIDLTIADIAAASEAYVDGLEAGIKAWKTGGKFSFEEIFDLIESGKFTAGDFNAEALTYKYDREKFMETFLPKEYLDLKTLIENAKPGEIDTDTQKQYTDWQPLIDAFEKNAAEVYDQELRDYNKKQLDNAIKSIEDGFLTIEEYKTLKGFLPGLEEHIQIFDEGLQQYILTRVADLSREALGELYVTGKMSRQDYYLALSKNAGDVTTLAKKLAELDFKESKGTLTEAERLERDAYESANIPMDDYYRAWDALEDADIAQTLATPITNATAYAELMNKKINGTEPLTESDYEKLITSIKGTNETLSNYMYDGVLTFQSVQDAVYQAIEEKRLDEGYANRQIEKTTKDFNQGFLDVLLKPTEAISEEIYLKYKDKFEQAGITLTQGVDGWDITTPIEEYLELVEELLRKGIIGNAADLAEFMRNKRQMNIAGIANTLEKTAPVAELSTTDFKEIAKSLNEVGVSAEQAATLVQDLGFAVDEFYKTANGEFALKNNLNSIEKINSRINKLTADGNKLNDKEIKQHRLLLDLAKQISRTKEDEAIDFMSPDESTPMDRETDIYLRLLENVGQLGTMLGDFQKDYQMTATDFINLTQDAKMAQAIRDAFGIPATEFMTGSALLRQVVEKAGASVNGDIITFSKEQAAAITGSLQTSTESIIQARIKSIDAQIMMLESFKTLDEVDFESENEINTAFALNDFVYTDSEGNEYTLKTPTEFHDYVMKNMPMDKLIEIAANVGITYNTETEEWVDAAGNKVDPNTFGIILMRELLGDTQRLNTFLNLSVTPKIENIGEMSKQEIEDYKKVLQEQIDEATKKLNESADLTEEQKEPLRKILSPDVPLANAEELYAALEKYNAALASAQMPPETEEPTAADGITEVETAMVEAGKEAETFKKTLVDTMTSIATEAGKAAAKIGTISDAQRKVTGKTIRIPVEYEEINKPAIVRQQTSSGPPLPGQKTDLAVARGTLSAKPGKTLVGELGPELRVSNGEYSLLGAQGAEFANLRRGDVVFDAQKTSALLRGRSNVRGKALAGGTGVDAAIAQLQKQKAALQDLLSNLGSFMGGAGGGGGGGGGDDKEYLMQLERWFNLLRQIEQLESHISVIQAKRANYLKGPLADGKKYAQSLYDENTLLATQNTRLKELINTQSSERLDAQADILKKYGSYFSFVGDAMQINSEAILAATKDNEDFGTELENVMNGYEELSKSVEENTVAYEENLAQIEENLRTMRDQYISMENEVLSALQDMYQKEIDEHNRAIEEKTKANEQYLRALRKSLDDERALYDKNTKANEKFRLQRRLALLQRDTSGRNIGEISSLQEQLRKLNQEDYFAARESAITGIESANQTEIDSMRTEADNLATINQMKLDNMELYWEEVQDIIKQGSGAVLSFLQSWSTTYLEASTTQREDYIDEWRTTIDSALEYARIKANELNQIFALPPAAVNLVSGTMQTGPASAPPPSSAPPSSSSGGGSGGSGGGTTSDLTHTKFTYAGKEYKHYKSEASARRKISELVTASSNAGVSLSTQLRYEDDALKSIRTGKHSAGYKKGGIVDFTGSALVHGSTSAPESFFDARATAALIDFTRVLQSQMTKINSNTPTLSDTGDTVGEMTVNIEVKTGVVNNAAQAGQLADEIFDKFTRQASKSGSIKVFRN